MSCICRASTDRCTAARHIEPDQRKLRDTKGNDYAVTATYQREEHCVA